MLVNNIVLVKEHSLPTNNASFREIGGYSLSVKNPLKLYAMRVLEIM